MKKFALSRFAHVSPIVSVAFACIALTAGAGPLDHPSMKEGLWKTHMVTTSNPGNKVMDGHYSVCHSHAFDEWNEARAKQPGCTTTSDVWNGNTRSVVMACNLHVGSMSTTIASKATTAMLSDTSVHTESHTTYSPAFMGQTEATMTMDNDYAGACPSGVQPGDRVSTDGSIMHLWKH